MAEEKELGFRCGAARRGAAWGGALGSIGRGGFG